MKVSCVLVTLTIGRGTLLISWKERIMQRPGTWKIVALGAAFTGLGVFGAGTALAESPVSATGVPATTAVAHAPVPLDPPFWDDDMIDWIDDIPYVPDVPGVPEFWDGPYWDDDWVDD
jgi:hypothetical protein